MTPEEFSVQRLGELKARYEAGEAAALLDAVAICINTGIKAPAWVETGFNAAWLLRWTCAEARTLGEAFGIERPFKWTQKRDRKDVMVFVIWQRVLQELNEHGGNKSQALFETVADNWNAEHKDDPSSPWHGIKLNATDVSDAFYAVKPKVVLTQEQRTRLINTTSGGLRDLVLGALLTGARPPGELASIRCQDFDPDTGTVVINGKTDVRVATLDKLAREFFDGLAAGKDPDALLFTKDDGEPWGKNHHIGPWNEAAKRAELPSGATMSCLRHTHISQRLLKGVDIHLLADELGTSVRRIECMQSTSTSRGARR